MPEKLSEQFQREAREMAGHAARQLREAAQKLDDTFTGAPLAQDGMEAVEAIGTGVWAAQSCIAHAVHRNSLALLHRERERGMQVERPPDG